MNAEARVAQMSVDTKTHDAGTPVLDEILSRVSVIEAKQGRPSPVHLRTWEEIERFAERAARSGMVPRDFIGKPDAICIAIQLGSELGLAPMQSLQSIAVINGRPSVWGDATMALCRASGVAAYIKEWHEGSGENLTYYCESQRRDDPNPVRASFSISDAKKAGLFGKAGPWTQYLPRMLQMRARGFGLRDAFPDVLKGLITTEEAQDIPFEATGLKPTLPAAAKLSEPDHTAAPKRTVADAINELATEFEAAATKDEVDAVLASKKCQYCMDYARNGDRERLDGIISMALARTALPADDTHSDDEAPAEADPEMDRSAEFTTEIGACQTAAEVRAFARNPAVQRKMREWKADRPALFQAVDDFIAERLLAFETPTVER